MMDINKFNFVQMFNNSKGKTSPMILIAFLSGLSGVSTFVACAIIMFVLVGYEAKTVVTNILNSVLMQSVAMVTLSLGALGVRRFTKDKEIEQKD
jgi:hypothetical protein